MTTDNKSYISIYVRNSKKGPSDYYRIIQYIPYLGMKTVIHDALNEREFSKNLNKKSGAGKKLYQAWLGIKIYLRRLRSILYDLANRPQIVIVQREVFPHFMGPIAARLFRRLGTIGKTIWDYDDDIFSNNEICRKEARILGEQSVSIVATSKYLISLLNENWQNKAIALPTTDGFCKKYNIQDLIELRKEKYNTEIRLVWIGTKVNLDNMEMILPYLDEAAREIKDKYDKKMVLDVVCNTPLECKTKDLVVNNIIWSREIAEETIANAHIGIMPLKETKYALGKGGFKLVQYMSVALPVVASSVGYNKEIVCDQNGRLIDTQENEKWTNDIVYLSTNYSDWIGKSISAQKRYDESFSIDNNIQIWKEMVKQPN